MYTLLNIRIPKQLKMEFVSLCKANSTSMTTELIRFIRKTVAGQKISFNQKRNHSRCNVDERYAQQEHDFVLPDFDDHQQTYNR